VLGFGDNQTATFGEGFCLIFACFGCSGRNQR
jgi:hypothetical protein